LCALPHLPLRRGIRRCPPSGPAWTQVRKSLQIAGPCIGTISPPRLDPEMVRHLVLDWAQAWARRWALRWVRSSAPVPAAAWVCLTAHSEKGFLPRRSARRWAPARPNLWALQWAPAWVRVTARENLWVDRWDPEMVHRLALDSARAWTPRWALRWVRSWAAPDR
jgi:hypothetical protein